MVRIIGWAFEKTLTVSNSLERRGQVRMACWLVDLANQLVFLAGRLSE